MNTTMKLKLLGRFEFSNGAMVSIYEETQDVPYCKWYKVLTNYLLGTGLPEYYLQGDLGVVRFIAPYTAVGYENATIQATRLATTYECKTGLKYEYSKMG